MNSRLHTAILNVLETARFANLRGRGYELEHLAEAIDELYTAADALKDKPQTHALSQRAIDAELARALAQSREPLPPPTPADEDELPF